MACNKTMYPVCVCVSVCAACTKQEKYPSAVILVMWLPNMDVAAGLTGRGVVGRYTLQNTLVAVHCQSTNCVTGRCHVLNRHGSVSSLANYCENNWYNCARDRSTQCKYS